MSLVYAKLLVLYCKQTTCICWTNFVKNILPLNFMIVVSSWFRPLIQPSHVPWYVAESILPKACTALPSIYLWLCTPLLDIGRFFGFLSRDSVVGIATKLWAGRPRSRSSSPSRVKNFLFSKSSTPALSSTQPPIQWVPGALSPGVKWPGREVDHSPPTSAEVKKLWIYTSTPHTPSWRSA
jgi:hypothetical protein